MIGEQPHNKRIQPYKSPLRAHFSADAKRYKPYAKHAKLRVEMDVRWLRRDSRSIVIAASCRCYEYFRTHAFIHGDNGLDSLIWISSRDASNLLNRIYTS